MNNNKGFDEFLRATLTASEYDSLVKVFGSKRNFTIRKRDPKSMTSDQVFLLSQILMRHNTMYDVTYIMETFMFPKRNVKKCKLNSLTV